MKIEKFDLLVAIYIGCVAISELMGGKTVPLGSIGGFSLHASVALLVVPLIFSISDVIVEVHGRERARSVVWAGLVVVAILMAMCLLATHLPPSSGFQSKNAAYSTVFGTSARIAAASLVAFACSELLDVWVFSKLRQKLAGKALWFRNNASNFVSQLVDSTVFLTLAFYAFGRPLGSNVGFLIGLILPYWILKCCMSVVETPLVYGGVKWLRTNKQTGKVVADASPSL